MKDFATFNQFHRWFIESFDLFRIEWHISTYEYRYWSNFTNSIDQSYTTIWYTRFKIPLDLISFVKDLPNNNFLVDYQWSLRLNPDNEQYLLTQSFRYQIKSTTNLDSWVQNQVLPLMTIYLRISIMLILIREQSFIRLAREAHTLSRFAKYEAKSCGKGYQCLR